MRSRAVRIYLRLSCLKTLFTIQSDPLNHSARCHPYSAKPDAVHWVERSSALFGSLRFLKSCSKRDSVVPEPPWVHDLGQRILYVTGRDSTPICRILACCRTSYEGNATLISNRFAFVLMPGINRRRISVTRSDDRDNQRQHEAPWLRRLLGARVDFER